MRITAKKKYIDTWHACVYAIGNKLTTIIQKPLKQTVIHLKIKIMFIYSHN